MSTIPRATPLFDAAKVLLIAAERFRELKQRLHPPAGAVVWLEDQDGRVLIFTRGEYRDILYENVDKLDNDVQVFELEPE